MIIRKTAYNYVNLCKLAESLTLKSCKNFLKCKSYNQAWLKWFKYQRFSKFYPNLNNCLQFSFVISNRVTVYWNNSVINHDIRHHLTTRYKYYMGEEIEWKKLRLVSNFYSMWMYESWVFISIYWRHDHGIHLFV